MAEDPSCPSCGRALPEGAAECPYCAAPTLDLRTPMPSISGYLVLRLLGEGGMGAVYLADDETLGRRVAIKVVSEKFAAEGEARARFQREARSMATVEHPHIVRVYSFGEVQGQAYLVMEYVEGEILAQRIKRLGKLPVEEALEILRQVVEALEAAWEKRIVHRDIKPTNILLDKRNQVRVADFGLAKPLHMEGDTTLSQKGYILGTPHYVSPEQVRGHHVDFRSDIYSLGIVLYEMLTGDRPFAGTTPFDVVDKQLHEALPPLKEKRPDVPEGVLRLLERMTQKDPADRPDSYPAILQSIDALVGRGRATPISAGTARPAAARAPWLKRAVVAAGTLVVLTVAWFAWKSFIQTPHAPSPVEEKRLVVAVTPFYGPDEDSAKEGKVMAALVEKAVAQRLGRENAKVLGVEETKQSVRDHDAARALGERLGASVVVWGEAFTLRGETEIQPYFTMVPPKKPPAEAEQAIGMQKTVLGQDPFAAIQERAVRSVVVGAAAPNQIELRKTSAAGVGDVVLFLAGIHALYTEANAEKALALFTQAPRTAESLRYRAQALLQLGKKEEAISALQEAVSLDPREAPSYAQLADLHMEANRFKEAVAAYRAASEAGRAYSTHRAIYYDGKLYTKDTIRNKRYYEGEPRDTPYLLARNPQTGNIAERYRLPGVPRSFAVTDSAISISYGLGSADDPDEATIGFSHGKFDRPIFYGGNFFLRGLSFRSGWAPVANFTPGMDGREHAFDAKFAPSSDKVFDDAPRSLHELEAALRAAIAKDPTQSWYLFFLGQALWSREQKEDAAKTWRALFAGNFPGIPYYEYSWMAYYFERLGQRDWADRAYEEALKRRKQLPQPIEWTSLIERMMNTPFLPQAAALSQKGVDLERAHLWLERAREISGICVEGDEFAAAAWAKYYRERGETEKARGEAAFFEKARAQPLNMTRISTQLDYAIYACVSAMLGYLVLLIVLLTRTAKQKPPSVSRLSRAMTSLRSRVASISGRERRVMAAAFLVVLISAAIVAPRNNLWVRIAAQEIGMMDSYGHPRFVGQVEGILKNNDAKETRYVAAVVNHMAGNTQRARELYRSLSGDPRAEKNLAALQKGESFPPEPLKTQDLERALAVMGWRNWLETVPKPGYVFTFFGESGGPEWPAAISFLFVALFALNVVLLLAFWRIPSQGPGEPAPPRGRARRWFERLLLVLVPGAYDMRRGCPGQGWVTFTLFAFALLVGLSQLELIWKLGVSYPAPGLVTGDVQANYLRGFPFPTPPGLPDLKAVASYHYWTFFWAYPHAKVFWTIVALAALTSLGLHLVRLRRIWRLE